MGKDWNGNSKSTYVTLGASNHTDSERQVNDYYATDPIAVDALYRLGFFDGNASVWEPACGGGHLATRMRELGMNVVTSDLHNYGFECQQIDFLKTKELLAPVIVTNPPYKYAKEFVEKSIELGADKIAMFLKLTFLEGRARRELFDKYPPKEIGVFTQRIQCAINGDPEMFAKSSAACYAWFIWEKGYQGDPIVKWCDKKKVKL